MRMSPIPPSTSVVRSFITSQLRYRPLRSFVLLGLIAVATSALATSAFSAGSLRQLFFGGAFGSAGADLSQPLKVVAGPTAYANMLQGSATLNSARRGHTATKLSDGRFLIAGGANAGGGNLSEAELFDPAAGTFAIVGHMALGRTNHAAVQLNDGRILISGGNTAIGATNTTEVFDPTTGAFASGPAMSVARAGHSATLFADGRVFIAGGDTSSGSAEIFDPSTGAFSLVGADLTNARSKHSAALLLDGRVLIAGGVAGDEVRLTRWKSSMRLVQRFRMAAI